MTVKKSIEAILKLDNVLFKKGLASAEGAVRNLGQSLTNVGQKASIAFVGGAAVITGLSKTAKDFEKGMRDVSTLLDTSTESMAKMSREVLSIARNVPASIGDLTAGLYDVRSAGIDSSKAMETLEASAKLSIAGLSSVKEATDITTSALNAFAKDGLTASETTDILFKTVKFGKTTVEQLAQSFGSTAPIIAAAGITLKDFSAATAALTTVGQPASVAQNALRAAIVALKKPTAEMQDIFKELGVSSGVELIQTSKNLGDVFSKVYKTSNRMGIAIEKATGRVEGAAAITSLATITNDSYVKTFENIISGSSALETAFKKQLDPIDNAKGALIVLAVQMGNELLPAIRLLSGWIVNLASAFDKLPKSFKSVIANTLLISTVVAGLSAAILLTVGSIATLVASFIGLKVILVPLIAGALSALGGTLIGTVIPAIISMGAAITGPAISAITALGGVITSTVIPAILAMGAALGTATGGLTLIIGGAITATVALAFAWKTNWHNIRGVTRQGIKDFKSQIQKLFAFLNNAFNTLKKNTIAVARAIRKALSSIRVPSLNFDSMIQRAKKAGTEVQKYFTQGFFAGGAAPLNYQKVAFNQPNTTFAQTDFGTLVPSSFANQSTESSLEQVDLGTQLQNKQTLIGDFLQQTDLAVGQFLDNYIQSVLTGNASIADSFKALGIQILKNMVNGVFKQIETNFLKLIKSSKVTTAGLEKVFKAFSGASSKVFQSFGNIVATVFRNMLSVTTGIIGKIFAATKAASIANSIIQVHEWAISAAKAVAGIPIAGPALAAAAYAAAMGLGLSGVAVIKGVQLAGFASGTPELPNDIVAQVHAGEMIVPKNFADAIRSGDLTLSGHSNNTGGQSEGGVSITINSPQLIGAPEEWLEQFESMLIEKANTIGSRIMIQGI
ncbi:MAG: phage tail tape measure protein [Cyanobacteria bacterium P01_H01_bin.74]